MWSGRRGGRRESVNCSDESIGAFNMMQPFGDSFSEIKARVKRQMQGEKIDDYIAGLIKNAYERAFDAQGIVLSKQEREILLKSVTQEILADMLENLKH